MSNVWKFTLPVIVLPFLVISGILLGSWWSFYPIGVAFVLIPLLDIFFEGTEENFTAEEEALERKNDWYDYLIYFMVPMQFMMLMLFAFRIAQLNLQWYEYLGMTMTMGFACGVFGINLGHELGHRTKKYEQNMSKSLLLTALYMHFYIEHNRGHHKNIATPLDPATSRLNEPIYKFYFRSITGGWASAWHIENHRLKKLGISFWSYENEMLRYQFIQIFYLVGLFAIFSLFGPFGWESGLIVVLGAIGAALFGILLLETVNYIEHYGLLRNEISSGRYEKVKPIHSWNSNHSLGRLLLFELTRHSDHHYNAGRKYQILRHFDQSPQMPTGYPGMMVVALIPPLWFKIMNPQVEKHRERVSMELS
ncbi:MAG TPA: alkane 1-monooxygenase [Chitinophagales bacterium]|nr:alkane 1-monooxygenase [Chitinophagales bacterium]